MKLVCPDCRHQNEPERIYCHECGTRLNRTDLVRKETAAREGDSAETHRRLQKMLNPRFVILRANLLMVAKILAGACVAAALVLIFMEPEEKLPPPATDLGPQIGLDLESALSRHQGAMLTYDEGRVNVYLSNVLKRKKAALNKPMLDFVGGRVGFDEGVVRFTAVRSLFGFPIYMRTDQTVAMNAGKVDAQNCGGALGRLPVHPAVMKYLDFLFGDVWTALEQERKQVAGLAAIQFHPKTVVLVAPAL